MTILYLLKVANDDRIPSYRHPSLSEILISFLCVVQETLKEDLGTPNKWGYNYFQAWKHLASGLSVGLSCMASGMCIGVVGEAGVYGLKHRDILIAVILMMIFAEAIALYGFIVGIVLASS